MGIDGDIGRKMAIYAALLGMTDSQLVETVVPPSLGLQPRAPRRRTLISATLLRAPDEVGTAATPQQDIIVRNVSERGMCLATRAASQHALPLADEIVCIRLPENGEYLAQVRWVEERAFGVELFSTLDIEALGAANRKRNDRFLGQLEPPARAPAFAGIDGAPA
jgi:hypothetical protein